MTRAQQLDRDTEIYRLADRIAEQTGRDGPERYHDEEELLQEAEAAWEAQQQGRVKPWHFTVVPIQDDQGVWGYTAVEPDAQVVGCDHWVTAASYPLAQGAVVADHMHVCMAPVIEETFNQDEPVGERV